MTNPKQQIEDLLPCISCGSQADPADGFGTCTCGNEKLRTQLLVLYKKLCEEVIGEDEKLPSGENVNGMKSIHRRKRNQLRQQQRNNLNKLGDIL